MYYCYSLPTTHFTTLFAMHIPPCCAERLRHLMKIFLEENQKLNLSAFRTPEQCWTGNVLDSLAAVGYMTQNPQRRADRWLDLGTGGGFPLLPLAICMPKAHHTGLDATRKKIDAVQRIADALDIQNITLLCGRAEVLGRSPEHRAQYDIVTARAVAPLHTLVEYAAPFLHIGGCLLAWKSTHIEQELQNSLLARAELSCHLVHKYAYELPEGFGKRQILVFEKMAKTPERFPRAIGEAKKKPLM